MICISFAYHTGVVCKFLTLIQARKMNNFPPQVAARRSARQEKRVFAAFSTPKTMLQVSFETGIFRANICRFIAMWQRHGKIALHHFGLCPISKHHAGFYIITK